MCRATIYDARNKFSSLVKLAEQGEPVELTRCAEKEPPAPYYDSQIAAIAIANGMILITHNTEDYAALCQNSMLKVEDCWE